mmetsp:Transcript_4686/g.7625  ORF Transcript_4686/g.7625 Transcript_4686/m.7625 type:complete len:143 (-) Transcript_4686:82-510(-)|eukprot:CAMPEP_0169088676 /NCGR_PEP_ID=MMETSP1015-20121227/14880_1 /TAXON_ID=342587 /ORGANISM="Karlodinium micrum, Strain CCMP2283" /LENGTH=142 /DNA_ID=CAMNT_0009148965 /DNA_START=62 /DNA_END=490 /DNA_ORIENTATION=-
MLAGEKKTEPSDEAFPSAIVAYCSWDVEIPFGRILEPGRIFSGGIPRGFEGTVHNILQPIQVAAVRQYPRDEASERYALLQFVRAAVARCGTERLDFCVGVLRLYLSHWPSLCGLVILAEFIRHFPAVRLELHYDNAFEMSR